MRVIQSAIALGVLAVSSGPAWPWGMDGHHTVGMIADIILKNDPVGAAAQQLLGATLSDAAVWADCAKGYCNRPLTPDEKVYVQANPHTHGVSPLAALDSGHVSFSLSPYNGTAGVIELEEGRAVTSLSEELQRLGHRIKIGPLQSGLGFVAWQGGRWSAAADARRDGSSIVRNATEHPTVH